MASPAQQYQEEGAHGILMITAWMLCASISIMIARFFRTMPGPKLLGVGIWFNIHRGLLTLTLLLTVSAFILIFIQAGVWETFSPAFMSAHAYIGTFVTFLVILNPILAMVRPLPEGNRRVYFNWVHWGVGMAAWILALINIVFGMFMLGLSATDPEPWVFLAFVVEHGVTELIFNKFKVEETKKIEEIVGKVGADDSGSGTLEISEKAQIQINQSRGIVMFRYAWMIFYCVSVLGYWLALVVLIGKTVTP